MEETQTRPITCLVRERQLRLFGHVARFPGSDPAHRVLSAQDPEGWRRPRGRPRATWMQQVGRYLTEMGMDWVSAWELAQEDPKQYRRMVDAARRCCSACPHT